MIRVSCVKNMLGDFWMNCNAQKVISVDDETVKLFFVDFSFCSMRNLIEHMHFLKTHLTAMSFEEEVTLKNEKMFTNYKNETDPLESLSSLNIFLIT